MEKEFVKLKDLGINGDNIKIDFQELGCGGMDWIDLAQDGTDGGHF